MIQNVESDDLRERRVRFQFKPNDYFQNEFLDLGVLYEGKHPVETTACVIDWNPGKNPIKQEQPVFGPKDKKQGNQKAKKEPDQNSFFRLFEVKFAPEVQYEDEIKDDPTYDFFKIADVVECVSIGILKFHAACVVGCDLTEQYGVYEQKTLDLQIDQDLRQQRPQRRESSNDSSGRSQDNNQSSPKQDKDQKKEPYQQGPSLDECRKQ